MKSALKSILIWLWQWEVVSSVAIGLLACGAVSAFYADQDEGAAWLAIAGVVVLTLKVLSWDELLKHEQHIWQSIFVGTAGAIVIGLLVVFAYQHRKQSLPSSAVKHSSKPVGQAVAMEKGPGPEIPRPTAERRPPVTRPRLIFRKEPPLEVKSDLPSEVEKSDVQNCTQSNCLVGTNYGVMSVTNSGPEPLTISEDQAAVIRSQMSRFAGRSVSIITDGITDETLAAMAELKTSLEGAGLKVRTSPTMIYMNAAMRQPPHGFSLDMNVDQGDIANAFVLSLRSARLIAPDAQLFAASDGVPGKFNIIIGGH